jgi:hypothetical protein
MLPDPVTVVAAAAAAAAMAALARVPTDSCQWISKLSGLMPLTAVVRVWAEVSFSVVTCKCMRPDIWNSYSIVCQAYIRYMSDIFQILTYLRYVRPGIYLHAKS